MYLKKGKTYPAYVLNITQIAKKVIILIITNGEGCHYLEVQKQLALLIGITSKNHGDFYCLNYLHLFATENKVCKNKDFCNGIMPSEDIKILETNQY